MAAAAAAEAGTERAAVSGAAMSSAAAAAVAAAVAGGLLSRSTSHFIEEGDLVLVYLSHNRNPLPVVVAAGATHVNSFGAFPHSTAFLGKPYGSRVNSHNGRGFVYVLRPTPELWTLSLPHRTQILYQADIAFITQQLNLSPGSRIIEAGTGSGSFTHALARTVGRAHQIHRFQGVGSESVGRNDPREQAAAERVKALSELDDTRDDAPADGRVFSFEFHAQRFGKAKVEFAAHGLSDVVRMTHRNVCKDGFALSQPLSGPFAETANGSGAGSSASAYPIVDAVFLDLPAPWEAVPYVRTHLSRSHTTKICCFSPCIEQVLKTVTALNAHGFTDVQTWEVLMREIESTPLAKATAAKYDPGSRGSGAYTPANGADDEHDLDEHQDEALEAGDEAGESAGNKRKKQHAGAGGKKRKRDDGSAASDPVAAAAAAEAEANKARWGLERPRDVTAAIQRILNVEERKERRRLGQVIKAKEERDRRMAARKAADEGAPQAVATVEDDDQMDTDALQNAGDADDEPQHAVSSVPTIQVTPSLPRLYEQAAVYGRLIPEMRGHTSYLTFGTMLAGVPGADVVAAPQPSSANGNAEAEATASTSAA